MLITTTHIAAEKIKIKKMRSSSTEASSSNSGNSDISLHAGGKAALNISWASPASDGSGLTPAFGARLQGLYKENILVISDFTYTQYNNPVIEESTGTIEPVQGAVKSDYLNLSLAGGYILPLTDITGKMKFMKWSENYLKGVMTYAKTGPLFELNLSSTVSNNSFNTEYTFGEQTSAFNIGWLFGIGFSREFAGINFFFDTDYTLSLTDTHAVTESVAINLPALKRNNVALSLGATVKVMNFNL